MRNNKMLRNTLILSIILVALVAVMVFAFSNEYQTISQNSADAAVLTSTFVSKDGYLYDSSNNIISAASSDYALGSDGKYHMTQAKYQSLYGSGVTAISTASGLRTFINNATSSSKGVLTADINYDMTSSGLNYVASATKFAGTLDGNGYKVTITPPNGGSYIEGNVITDYGSLYGENRSYFYTGLLMGANAGSIRKGDSEPSEEPLVFDLSAPELADDPVLASGTGLAIPKWEVSDNALAGLSEVSFSGGKTNINERLLKAVAHRGFFSDKTIKNLIVFVENGVSSDLIAESESTYGELIMNNFAIADKASVLIPGSNQKFTLAELGKFLCSIE